MEKLYRTVEIAFILMIVATFAASVYTAVAIRSHTEVILDDHYDPSDVNQDGSIDIVDLSILMSNFDGDNSVKNLCQTLTE